MNNCSQDYNFINLTLQITRSWIFMKKTSMWPSRVLLKITFVRLILILWYDTVSWFTMVLDLLTLLHTISFFGPRKLLLYYSSFRTSHFLFGLVKVKCKWSFNLKLIYTGHMKGFIECSCRMAGYFIQKYNWSTYDLRS